jgi:hypothetical protein
LVWKGKMKSCSSHLITRMQNKNYKYSWKCRRAQILYLGMIVTNQNHMAFMVCKQAKMWSQAFFVATPSNLVNGYQHWRWRQQSPKHC